MVHNWSGCSVRSGPFRGVTGGTCRRGRWSLTTGGNRTGALLYVRAGNNSAEA